jgi:hypothetical protein
LAKSYWIKNVCFDLLYNSAWNISHSKNNSVRYYHTWTLSSCKVSALLTRLWSNVNFLDRFSKNTHTSNFMKIRPVGAELFLSEQTYIRDVTSNKCRPMRAVCYSSQCVVTHYTLLSKLNFTSGGSLCWTFYWNVSIVLPEDDPLRVETCWSYITC